MTTSNELSIPAARATPTPEKAAKRSRHAGRRAPGPGRVSGRCWPEAENWAKLLLREHLDPSAAFDLVYADAAKSALDLLAALIAHADNVRFDDEAVLVRAFAAMGEVLVFRAVHSAVKQRLD